MHGGHQYAQPAPFHPAGKGMSGDSQGNQGTVLGMTHLDGYSQSMDPHLLLQENGQLKITNSTLKKALEELRTQMTQTEKHTNDMMQLSNQRYQQQIADLSRQVHGLTQVLNKRLKLSEEESALLSQTNHAPHHMQGAYNMPMPSSGYYAPLN